MTASAATVRPPSTLVLNHPLAGKTLNFDVKVTDITTAEAR
jgi:FKBP-type peptidyl-prolyl cis-trans isomerase 2